jgi:hypothetical protein
MGYHLELVMMPLSVDIIAATASTSDPTLENPSAHTIMIEAYTAKDFIKEVSKDGAILFTCILTDPIHACTTSVVCDTPSTSVLPDSIPKTKQQALAAQLPEEFHKFHNVFTGTVASYLPPHHMYDIKFNIEEGQQVLQGPILLVVWESLGPLGRLSGRAVAPASFLPFFTFFSISYSTWWKASPLEFGAAPASS